MYEAILENFSTFATFVVTAGSTIMIIVESLDILYFSAIALILVFLAIRKTKKKDRTFFTSSESGSTLVNDCTSGRIFKRQHTALKKCPKCAEQLQLSALICDACDYNFLSGMVGQRDRLLPSPELLAH